MEVFTWLAHVDWIVVGQIVLIDILLGGDNAVVIALACRNLPEAQRRKGIIWGAAGAILLRVALVAFAVTLLELPGLKLVGGLLLLWIGIKLLQPEAEGEAAEKIQGSQALLGAIKTIIIADLVMSIDNVIAIAGAAQQGPADHAIWYVIFGLVVSVPFIVFGSQIILKLIDRFPAIVVGGAALLGFIAGELILEDKLVEPNLGLQFLQWEYVGGVAGAVLVVVLGTLLARRHKRSILESRT
ncbi:TerC family protein [soil metagenome]